VPTGAATSLLNDQIETHEHRIAALEQLLEALTSRNARSSAFDSPRFGEYAALRRALGFEREHASWCRWLLAELTSTPKRGAARTGRQPAVGRSSVARRR
jgi:hypothetical protein